MAIENFSIYISTISPKSWSNINISKSNNKINSSDLLRKREKKSSLWTKDHFCDSRVCPSDAFLIRLNGFPHTWFLCNFEIGWKKMFSYSFSDSIHLCPSKICLFYWSHELSRLIRHNTFLPRPDHWRSSGTVIKFSILTHIISMYFIFNVRKTLQKVPFDVFFHPIWPIILFFISYERTL